MRAKLLGLTILFTFIGIITFIFCLVYKIYAAASWNFITGLLHFIITHIIFLKLRRRLSQWYGLPELESFIRLGFCFMGVSITGTVYHLAYFCMTLYYQLDVGVTLWLPILSAFGTFLSAFLLCLWANKEQREL